MTPLQAKQKLFEVRDQIHILHLNTSLYSEHIALDILYKGWGELADTFIETYQGKYGRIEGITSIECDTDCNLGKYLVSVVVFLNQDINTVIDPYIDSDLLNIIADMKQLINQTMYRLTLK